MASLSFIQILTLLAWVSLFFYIPFLLLFYRNRKIHPIKGRAPRVVIFLAICLFLLGTHLSTVILYGLYSCVLVEWLFAFLLPVAEYIYIVRLAWLFFHFKISQNIMELQNQTDKSKIWEQNWYTRHRRLIQFPFLMKVGMIIFSFILLFMIILTAIFSEMQSVSHRCYYLPLTLQQSIWNYFFNAFLGLSGLGAVFLAWQIRNYPTDAFRIKTEYKIGFYGAGVGFVVNLFCTITKVSNPSFFYFMVLLLLHLLFLVGTVWPYFLSRRELQLLESPPPSRQLTDFLKSPKCFEAFFNYLRSEFSSENLLFWTNVNQFKTLNLNEIDMIQIQATQIYETFIRADAPCQVNLPHTIVEQIARLCEQLNDSTSPPTRVLDIFNEAQKEIYRLMESDSYLRFERTEAYEQLAAELYQETILESKGSASKQLRFTANPRSVAEKIALGEFDLSMLHGEDDGDIKLALSPDQSSSRVQGRDTTPPLTGSSGLTVDVSTDAQAKQMPLYPPSMISPPSISLSYSSSTSPTLISPDAETEQTTFFSPRIKRNDAQATFGDSIVPLS